MSTDKTGIIAWLRSWFDDIYELKGQATVIVDSIISSTSRNPVENRAIYGLEEDILDEFADNFTNSGSTTPISNDWLDSVYPVGSIYMNVNDVNPTNLIGGSWQKLEDRFLLGSGTRTLGSTGGSKDAVVVSHNHGTSSGWRFMEANGGLQSGDMGTQSGSGRHYPYQNTNSSGSYWNTSYTTGNRGEDGTDKNMPPYLVVHMWKRTA